MLISFKPIDHLAGTSRQDFIRLEPNTVHLWGIELDGSPHCVKRCAEWLDETEQHRATRLVREENRRQYVLAHGGLRAVLGRYLRLTPDLVALDRSATGKPFLKKSSQERSAITFNLSHAHGRALIAISKAQEVGVDLELVRSNVEVVKLSERYFAPSEHAVITQATEAQRAMIFFRYWVVKEAVLKAQGIGLRGLSDCEVVLGQHELNRDVQVRLGSRLTAPLHVCLLSCGEGWEAAVAAQDLNWVRQGNLEQW
jgi:4'-phosphopantetheinyl transferase